MATTTATPTDSAIRRREPLHVGLWILQILLAATFLFFGGTKLMLTADDLAGVTGALGSLPMIRFIGAAEVLGAVGLVAPAATRRLPGLTPLAAFALATVVLLAVGVHLGRAEYPQMIVPLVLAVLLLVVVWGRDRARPIPARHHGPMPRREIPRN